MSRAPRAVRLALCLLIAGLAVEVAYVVAGTPSDVLYNGVLVGAALLAYPVGDTLLLVLLVGAVGLTGWRPDRPLALVGVGLMLSGVADIVNLSSIAYGMPDAPAWIAPLWPASALVTAIAAWQPLSDTRAVPLKGRRLLALPLGGDGGDTRPAPRRPLPRPSRG